MLATRTPAPLRPFGVLPVVLGVAAAIGAPAPARAQHFDLSAIADCSLDGGGGGGGNTVTLSAGRYLMRPVRGAFVAWYRWPGDPVGCDADGGNCNNGWTVYWDIRRADGSVEHFPDAQVPLSARWLTPDLALAHAQPVVLSLDAAETVTFFIYDAPCSDNSGGVSLDVIALCASDFNADGTVNSTDVSDFINAWFEDLVNGTVVTDWDRNGVVNSTDVSEFINDWFEGVAAGCG